MARILIDTNIWIQHFKTKQESIIKILHNEEIVSHPLILGELHLGVYNNPSERQKVIELLNQLECLNFETNSLIYEFINSQKLYGKKIGFIDSHLLYSTIKNKVKLWTMDKNLLLLARQMNCSWT